ncbi:MAG: succinate dehydrogenase assembly factor 4 [Pseudomonadota bacterium]
MLMQPLEETSGKGDETGSPPTPMARTATLPELGGPAGPEPTRFGDWERRGRCIDF